MVEPAGSIGSVVSPVLEVGKWLAAPLGRQFMYLYNYESNFKNLEREVEKLKEAKEEVKDKVVAAEKNVEKIKQNVVHWQKDVNSIIHETEQLIAEKANDRCFKGFCPNLITCYKHGKKAFKLKEDAISRLLQQKENFNNVSYPTILEEMWLKPDKNYDAFESRYSTLNDILMALNDANMNMIGVHGMGGIGKTTLVKAIGRHAKKDKIFDVVVFVEVNQTPDIEKVQNEIARNLGLKFEAETPRASKLYERLKKKEERIEKKKEDRKEERDEKKKEDKEERDEKKREERNEEKILIILDNVWGDLDLKSIGIPDEVGDRGCKLLLTARDRLVLANMGDPDSRLFQIGVLSEEESWRLFKTTTGDFIEKQDLKFLVKSLCKKCDGLPIAIVTMAKALRNKKHPSQWREASRQLKRCSSINFKGEMKMAYSTIELSYNYLSGDDLKKTFLLCSLMGHQGFILDLVKCVMGLDMFQGIYKIEEARDKVYDLVQQLKESSLLLDDDASELFSMHDFVRDVALSINQQNQLFFVRNEAEWDWPHHEKLKTFKKIFIRDSSIGKLCEELDCPQLEYFFMNIKVGDSYVEVPEKFFSGMKELKVLDLSRIQFFSLQSSLHLLVNLQTLSLEYCRFEDVAIIGNLKKLKILSLRGSNIEQLPGEIGQLTQLQLLDLSDCSELKVIAPNVISNLLRLEELYMSGCSVQWKGDELNDERSNASLEELKHLSKLTTLEIYIEDEDILPKGLFSRELNRYKISIGYRSFMFGGSSMYGGSSMFGDQYGKFSNITDKTLSNLRTLKLNFESINCLEELRGIKNVEFLCLEVLQGINNVLFELDNEGFTQLKHLHVHNNPNFKCIVDARKCDSFPAFPLLDSLVLLNLNNLEKICYGQPKPGSFHNLKIIEVEYCDRLKNIFSSSNASTLQQLQRIDVVDCWDMEAIFAIEIEDNVSKNEAIDKIEFCQLRILTLSYLPRLASFYSEVKTSSTLQTSQKGSKTNLLSDINSEDEFDTLTSLFNKKVVFPKLEILVLEGISCEMIWDNQLPPISFGYQNLTHLTIENLYKLKYVFPSFMVKSFKQLKYLEINNCKELKEIVAKEEGAEAAVTFMFPRIEFLKLRDLPELTTFYPGIHISEWPKLTKLEVYNCDKLHIFTSEYKVVFPNMEDVGLQAINSQMIWDSQLPILSDYYQSLTRLIIKNIGKLKYVFPSSVIQNLKQLQYLEISSCKELKEIVAKEGGETHSTFIFPRIEFLKLGDLPELTTFYPGIHISEWPMLKKLNLYDCQKLHIFTSKYKVVFPNLEAVELRAINSQMILDSQLPIMFNCYQNLTSLIIHNIGELKYIFPSFMVKNFEQLRRLQISSCKDLKEIVIKEGVEATPTFMFPRVEILKLKNLPELSTFYREIYTSEWPMLKELEVSNCHKLQMSTLEYFKINLNGVLRADSMRIWQCLFPAQFSFKGTIEIKGDESTNIPLDILQKSIYMENLVLRDSSYKEIFSCGEDDIHKRTLIQIKSLELRKLFNLKHLWRQDSKLDSIIQNLGVLKVIDCHNLINLLPSPASFTNLTVLRVDCCLGLINLCTPSTAKSLVQLREMKIGNCIMMIEIISNEDYEDVGVEDEIVFNKLKLLSLKDLESLTCFCFGNYTFKFPALEELIVQKCPNMKTFCGGALSSPSLQKLKFEQDESEGCQEVDLNTTIQHLQEKMVNFVSEEMTLIGRDIMPIWQDPFLDHQFFEVKVLKVIKDESTNIPTEILQRFKSLKKLILQGSSYPELFSCGENKKPTVMLTQIKELLIGGLFNLQYTWKQDSYPNPLLPNLENLGVIYCHKLITLVPSSTSFENLKTLSVVFCDGLMNLVSSSTAKSLVQLKEMTIVQCEMMTEVVLNERDVENNEIVFNKLKTLTLWKLGSLTSFCSGNYAFKFLALEELIVGKCPNMKIFSGGVLSAPSLQKVKQKENDNEGCWKGDLNTTIQHLYRKLNIRSSEKDLGQTSVKSPE